MGLRPTETDQNQLRCHPRESGGPLLVRSTMDSRFRGNDVGSEKRVPLNQCARAFCALAVNCKLSTVNFLKYVLQTQLNLPGRLVAVFICRLHDAERRRVEGSARNIKVRDIEKVKELEADFESSAFVPERDSL